MSAAVDRILAARDNRETVVVHGDYDADGVTSTALLVECLASLGLTVVPFIPTRDAGYDLKAEVLSRLHETGATLVIAIDCGITAVREVEHARDLGLDIIIADHHHVARSIPRAVAVINPHQSSCRYPFKDLCAVGIAYKLALALFERTDRDPSEATRWLDLVAMGTVADVVPLMGENRALVVAGLRGLNQTTRPGLQALFRQAGLNAGEITSRSIGYVIAPRLNASGRLNDATVSLDLLLTESVDRANELAGQLEEANRERRQLTSDAVDLARFQVNNLGAAAGRLPTVLMVKDASFRAGVVGLVAGRLVEEFGRPALVGEERDGKIRGSARSIEGFHLAEALARCAEWLDHHGGHAMAAGFTMGIENWPRFQQALELVAASELSDANLERHIRIDVELTARKHTADILEVLDRLEPLGIGNLRPVFRTNGLQIREKRVVGATVPGHLKLRLFDPKEPRSTKTIWEAIGFGMGARMGDVSSAVDIVYSVERNTWDGRVSAQFRLLDLRPSSPLS